MKKLKRYQMTKKIIHLYATNTGPRTPIYYVDQIPNNCEKCDYLINRSGQYISIDNKVAFPELPNKDEIKVLLVGGLTKGIEHFEQAFTVQQIETIRYISSAGYSIELHIKGISSDISHLF